MTLYEIVAILAAFGFIIFAVSYLLRQHSGRSGIWLFPASLSVLFLTWSLIAVFVEGPTGFWTEHVRNLWGNQIWIDLLLAIGICWFFLEPKARTLGMNRIPWLLFILLTGCIGVTAMLSRVLYLESRTEAN